MELKELSKSEELLFQLTIEKAKHYQNAAIAYSNLNQGDTDQNVENLINLNINYSIECLEEVEKILHKDPNDTESDVSKGYIEKLLRTKLKDLNLSIRIINCLNYVDITEVGQVIHRTRNDLLKIPNLGTRSVDELIKVLGEEILTLGTALDSWSKRENDF